MIKTTEPSAQVKLSDSANTSPSFNSTKLRKRTSKTSLPHVTHSSRSSLHMFPIISGLVDKQNLEIGKFQLHLSDTFQFDRTEFDLMVEKISSFFQFLSFFLLSIHYNEEYGALRDGSLPSCYSSNTSLDRPWSPAPKDDLYAWMAKQHNEHKDTTTKENAETIIVNSCE